ncbi:MAG: VWA domain-containing protein [Pirellulaceae bacterium]|nr:VWA domain-containing protein [Pirellulaceae bacterium]
MLPLVTWWHWALLILLVAAIASLSVGIYRRDASVLPPPIAKTLLALRLMTLAGLLVFFLGPEKRSEARILKPSRLAVLIDTSLSMGLIDNVADAAPQQRMDAVVDLVQETEVIQELNQEHELLIYRFGESNRPDLILKSEKQQPVMVGDSNTTLTSDERLSWVARVFGGLGQLGLLLAVFCVLLTLALKRKSADRGAHSLAAASLLLVSGVFLLGLADLLVSQWDLSVSLGWAEGKEAALEEIEAVQPTAESIDWTAVDWNKELAPQGVATRLGEAVQEIVNQNRGSALAGMILISDGQSNQGLPPSRAIAAASDANIPVYAIGVGSNRPARNVRISEMDAPGRVFPDDNFKIDAVLQSYGLQGETVRVRLTSAEDEGNAERVMEDERMLQLPPDGEPIGVSFEVAQATEGKRRYFVEVEAPQDDLDISDNVQSTLVQVIQRKTRVLLIAGGPTRDYQFLRNQLFRDANVELDVWLQLARPGADQESDNLLFGFPENEDALESYDCIVAFDPDWRLLSKQQADGLERWVSEKAGGLLVIAGPVFTPEWTRRPRGEATIDLIRGLYPVSFYSQGTATLKLGRFGGRQPFPLEFTREGRSSRHLWLGGEDSADSISTWDSFDGVYGYYAVNESKAGADVLARFSDDATAIDDELPIYLASHYYGSGRVFFQASGEVWRLRNVDVDYFQTYYLNLIRWVSEGRLLRDSSRGVLLLDRNRCWVGDQLMVRAILRDAADQPLMQKQVEVSVRRPDGVVETIPLVNEENAARPGTFTGQFVASLEGSYDVSLLVPFAVDGQVLNANVRASIPDLEKVKPQRNDQLLKEIAERTSGRYFFDLEQGGRASWNEVDSADPSQFFSKTSSLAGENGLAQMIGVVDQESFLPGSPDESFSRKFSRWLVFWLVLVLSTEWILRRLHKLA